MSGTQKLSGIHISGATLSHIAAATYVAEPGVKYMFDVYGHHDTRTEVTDTSEQMDLFDVVVVGAVPRNSKFRGTADHVGYLSISKSPFHKLSFEETALLTRQGDYAANTSARDDPKIFINVTSDPNNGNRIGTRKIEYTAYQLAHPPHTQYRVVPLKTDNVVDSLQGFTKIGDLCCRNPSVIHQAKRDSGTDDNKSVLDMAVARIESSSREKAELIERIEKLHSAIEAKKKAAAI